MPTRNVVLTDRHEEMIETLVRSGRYQNASEVLREGLRLVERREAEDVAKLKALRDAVHLGIASLDRGDYEEFDTPDELAHFVNDLTEEVLSNPER